ncbi:hypothetical protein HY095_06110 [Candidatus Micrarchaeota archaeon]|nr:hypothetical protein [Candidatus Micrarchaeota archaeon]
MSARRGIVFSLDAILALSILLLIIPFSSFLRIETTPTPVFQNALNTQAQGAVDALTRVRVADLRFDPVVAGLFNQGLLTDANLNLTVLEVLGAFWAENTTLTRSAASNLSSEFLGGLLPPNAGWALSAEVGDGEDIIYNSTPMPSSALILFRSTRFASGYQINKPPTGYSARAYVDSLGAKRTGSHTYFGGFTGWGNVSEIIYGIPPDATVKSIFIEGVVGGNAVLSVNGFACGTFPPSADPAYAAGNWTIADPNCLSSVVPGAPNRLGLNFTNVAPLQQFVGGGFAKIAYDTKEFGAANSTNVTYRFAGIRGAVNLYDSFYVPGTATGASVHLVINSTYPAYLNIGNATVLTTIPSNSPQTVDLGNSTLSAALGGNLGPLSNANVPLRLGLSGLNYPAAYNPSELMPESYIRVNYTGPQQAAGISEVTFLTESERFGGCTGAFAIPPALRPQDVRITAYSGSGLWTSNVTVNSSNARWANAFYLPSYGANFADLGDASSVGFPASLLVQNETNFATVVLASSGGSPSPSCSGSSRAVYAAGAKASVPYGVPFSNISGFNVTVYYDLNRDGIADGFSYAAVGRDLPNFNPTPIDVDAMTALYPDNAYADAVRRLLYQLNFYNPASSPATPGSAANPIDLALSNSVSVQSNQLSGIPFLWGPTSFSIRVWG